MFHDPRLTTLAGAALLALAGFMLAPSERPAGLPVVPFGVAVARAQQPQPEPSSVSAAGIRLHSVSVELPTSERMFPGEDADAINSSCLACHSAGMVLPQPALTRAAWQQEVDKMRGTYKAPIDPDSVPAIVDYLAAHKGKS
jgi:cytochrome c5